jgi:hypothetical protein
VVSHGPIFIGVIDFASSFLMRVRHFLPRTEVSTREASATAAKT